VLQGSTRVSLRLLSHHLCLADDKGGCWRLIWIVEYSSATCEFKTPSKRALRWGGNYSMPMLIGQQTTPWVLKRTVGYTLLKKENPWGLVCRSAAREYG
jgi:hypothetical protein